MNNFNHCTVNLRLFLCVSFALVLISYLPFSLPRTVSGASSIFGYYFGSNIPGQPQPAKSNSTSNSTAPPRPSNATSIPPPSNSTSPPPSNSTSPQPVNATSIAPSSTSTANSTSPPPFNATSIPPPSNSTSPPPSNT